MVQLTKDVFAGYKNKILQAIGKVVLLPCKVIFCIGFQGGAYHGKMTVYLRMKGIRIKIACNDVFQMFLEFFPVVVHFQNPVIKRSFQKAFTLILLNPI